MINSAGIIGTGAYLPKKKLNNLDLGKICKISSKEIYDKTGIKFRRIANKDETASSMGYKASIQAINNSKINAQEIE